MTVVIQLGTVNRKTCVRDYWDESVFNRHDFEEEFTERGKTACLTDEHGVEELLELADADSFIVDYTPDMMDDHPIADISIEIYDGYVD